MVNDSPIHQPDGTPKRRQMWIVCIVAILFLLLIASLLIWKVWIHPTVSGSHQSHLDPRSGSQVQAGGPESTATFHTDGHTSPQSQGQSRNNPSSSNSTYCQTLAQTRQWLHVLHGMGVNQAVGKQAENMKDGNNLADKLAKMAPSPKEKSDWKNVAQKTQLAFHALDAFDNQHDFRQSMEDYGGEPNQTLRRVDDSMLQVINDFNDTWIRQCNVDMVDRKK